MQTTGTSSVIGLLISLLPRRTGVEYHVEKPRRRNRRRIEALGFWAPVIVFGIVHGMFPFLVPMLVIAIAMQQRRRDCSSGFLASA